VTESENTLNQQAWNYYQVHAEQRLIAANFYISIASVLAGALFAVLQSAQTMRVGALLGVLLIVLSFVFWKWVRRTSDLIKIAEDALKYFEGLGDLKSTGEEPHVARIFQREAYLTTRKRKKRSILFWQNYFTYRTCLNLIFISFALAGAFGAVLAAIWPIP
jgi:lipopolysaccharide export LptBFGC system permease protein LptF